MLRRPDSSYFVSSAFPRRVKPTVTSLAWVVTMVYRRQNTVNSDGDVLKSLRFAACGDIDRKVYRRQNARAGGRKREKEEEVARFYIH